MKLRYLVIVAVILILALLAFQIEGVTNFTGVHIANSTFGTATPSLMVDNSGTNVIAEFRDAATPVVRFADGGGIDVISGGLTVTAGGLTLSDGDMVVADDLRITAQTFITVTNAATFTVTGTYQEIRAASEVTPTIAAGTDGDVVILINGSDQTINLADSGTLATSGSTALGQYDTLTLIYSDTASAWVEIAQANN